MNPEDIIKQAESEIAAEDHRAAVEREKERIRIGRKYWFPWRLRLVRIDNREHGFPTRIGMYTLVQPPYYKFGSSWLVYEREMK